MTQRDYPLLTKRLSQRPLDDLKHRSAQVTINDVELSTITSLNYLINKELQEK